MLNLFWQRLFQAIEYSYIVTNGQISVTTIKLSGHTTYKLWSSEVTLKQTAKYL